MNCVGGEHPSPTEKGISDMGRTTVNWALYSERSRGRRRRRFGLFTRENGKWVRRVSTAAFPQKEAQLVFLPLIRKFRMQGVEVTLRPVKG